MTIAWVDRTTGEIRRLTSDDGKGPQNAVAVGDPPESGRQIWDFTTQTWSPPPSRQMRPPITDSSAPNVVALRADFNGLLAELRAERLIESP